MATGPIFPGARRGAGMYESYYLRAVSPTEPVGVWIRNTVHKRPGTSPTGSVWCTVFDARRGRPFMHKVTREGPRAPQGAWIAIGEESVMGPGRAEGSCGEARWALRYTAAEGELRHLAPELLYRLPLPRTKLTSPAPAASFDGVLELAGEAPLRIDGWPGMVGHNWGSEHAERWIWLHGVAFAGTDAWLDLALGRLRVAGRLTPWLANGCLSFEGRRHRLGGLGRRPRVREGPEGCSVSISGAGGVSLEARAEVPALSAAGWRYADPDGGEHDVLNCSIAALEVDVRRSAGDPSRALRSDHGGAYELGMRERDHGTPIAPFPDG